MVQGDHGVGHGVDKADRGLSDELSAKSSSSFGSGAHSGRFGPWRCAHYTTDARSFTLFHLATEVLFSYQAAGATRGTVQWGVRSRLGLDLSRACETGTHPGACLQPDSPSRQGGFTRYDGSTDSTAQRRNAKHTLSVNLPTAERRTSMVPPRRVAVPLRDHARNADHGDRPRRGPWGLFPGVRQIRPVRHQTPPAAQSARKRCIKTTSHHSQSVHQGR